VDEMKLIRTQSNLQAHAKIDEFIYIFV